MLFDYIKLMILLGGEVKVLSANKPPCLKYVKLNQAKMYLTRETGERQKTRYHIKGVHVG